MNAHDTFDGNTGKPVSVLSGERSTAETETEIEAANDRNRRVAAYPARGAATGPVPAMRTSFAGRALRPIGPTRSTRPCLMFTAISMKYASRLLQLCSRSLAIASCLFVNLPTARSHSYKKLRPIFMKTE